MLNTFDTFQPFDQDVKTNCIELASVSKIPDSLIYIIKSNEKYPEKLFDAISFIDCALSQLNLISKRSQGDKENFFVSIDISDDISVTSRAVELVLNGFREIPIYSLNLSGTSIEENILCLLYNKNITYINICDTTAALVLFDKPNKNIIFLRQEDLYSFDDLNGTILDYHIKYYNNLHKKE